MLFQLPRDCRVYTKISPANQWGWNEIFANKTNYLLELLVWSKSKDAQRRYPRKQPKLFTPEFMKQPSRSSAINKESELHTTDDIKSILSLPRT